MNVIYSSKQKRILSLCLILVAVITISVIASHKCKKEVYIDKEYLQALNIADRYLCAWVMRDGSIAYNLITDNLKKNFVNLKDFQINFAGASNPHHQAFEIYGFKRINKNKICIKAWLYEDYTGIYFEPFKRTKPYVLQLIKVGKGNWLIDKISLDNN